jgi:copper homeostasis protein
MAKRVVIEACVDSVDAARAAEQGGADRIELCGNLADGGTTPSAGMIAECRATVRLPIYVMIRPRGGDFIYSAAEFQVMKRDVIASQELGADGLVFGMLTADRKVDRKRLASLVKLGYPLDLTFHRAIDRARKPLEALDALIGLGIDRVLTSGGAVTAAAGSKRIRAMIEHAAGRIGIMAGGGVTGRNARLLVKRTGVGEVHFSVADAAKVRRVIEALRST